MRYSLIMTLAKRCAFVEDGVVILPKLVPLELCRAAAEAIEAVETENVGDSEPVQALYHGSPLCALLQELLGGETQPVTGAQIAVRHPTPPEQLDIYMGEPTPSPSDWNGHVDGIAIHPGPHKDDPDRETSGKGDAAWPDLVLLDGGKGQMSTVRDTLAEMGIDNVPLIAIAKGPDHGREGREVFHFPDGREKTLPVNSPLLFHLQNLRDEVHRYVIGAHRAKRSRAITASPLDEIPGIGPSRKRALLLHFGTAGKVRAAALDDLKRAPGISDAVAQQIYDFYHAN